MDGNRLHCIRSRSGGFTIPELVVTATMVAVLAAIAIPNLLDARKGANESAAISSLRTLTTAQTLFRDRDGDRDGIVDYAKTLRELGEADLIDDVLGNGTKQGYSFKIVIANDLNWSATAVPGLEGRTGDRSFFVDEKGEIRALDPRVPGRSGIRDDPSPSGIASRLASLVLRDVLDTLSDLVQENLADAVSEHLRNDGVLEDPFHAMDSDGDGLVDLEEVLSADPLGIARRVLGGGGSGREVGPDALLLAVTDCLSDWLVDYVGLGTAEEDPDLLPGLDDLGPNARGKVQAWLRSEAKPKPPGRAIRRP